MDNGYLFWFQLPSTISARVLLTHYKWDLQQLVSEYYESNCDTFFEKIHVANPFKILPENPSNDTAECKICNEDEVSTVNDRQIC